MPRFTLAFVVLCSAAVAGIPAPSVPLTAAEPDQHAYFNRLSARPEVLHAYGLRDQAQIDSLSNSRLRNTRVTYQWPSDSYPLRQDAAKITIPGWGRLSKVNAASTTPIPEKIGSENTLTIPLDVTSGRIFLTWDAWFGPEWPHGVSKSRGHKMFRHEVGRLAWLDWNTGRYWADDDLYVATPGIIPGFEGGAKGLPPGPPGPGWFTGNILLPLTGMTGYRIQHSRWIRYWEDFDFEINPGYATYSAWMADEFTEPFKVYDNIQWVQDPRPYAEGGNTVAKGLTRLRFLYDTSADYRGKPDAYASVPDMVGYLRNVVALTNIKNPSSLLERPVGTSGPVPAGALSAPRNLRVVQ